MKAAIREPGDLNARNGTRPRATERKLLAVGFK